MEYDMPYDFHQFKDLITRIITAQELYSKEALYQILGTAAAESDFGTYLRQIDGPALGAFQMEPDTEKDIWENYLYLGRPEKRKAIFDISGVRSYNNNGALEWNLAYAICMCRLHYRRVKWLFPELYNVEGRGYYWDVHYNRNPDKGTVSGFIKKWDKYCKRHL